jgi:hypothetical protein
MHLQWNNAVHESQETLDSRFYELADMHLTYGMVKGYACATVRCHVENNFKSGIEFTKWFPEPLED